MGLIETLPLSPSDGKVADGIRYHVLDVWVDGLVGVEEWEDKGLMGPVERWGREGMTKVVRERAKGVLADERLAEGGEEGIIDEGGYGGEEEGFEGSEA